jgi:hypothetical protein
MIKALFLIFDTEDAWDRVAQSHRSLLFIVMFYLLPMMVIVGVAEGYSLVEWGHGDKIKPLTREDAAIAEAVDMLLIGVAIAICAYTIKALSETFRGPETYTRAFKVVVYGLSPLFLLRLLNVVPQMPVWLPWALGMMLCLKILYTGIPQVMRPDPPHAFGLFLMSAFLLVIVLGLERFITAGYLAGQFKPIGQVVQQIIHHIVDKFHILK